MFPISLLFCCVFVLYLLRNEVKLSNTSCILLTSKDHEGAVTYKYICRQIAR